MSSLFVPSTRLDAAALGGYAQRYGASVLDMDRSLEAVPAPPALIDLTHGDTRAFVPPPHAAGDVRAAIEENTQAYTPYRGSASLRAALSGRVGALLGRPVDPERELIVTPGTQGGLFAALSAFVSPGDLVALPDPEYFMTERIVRYLGAEIVRIPLSQADESGALSIEERDLDAVRRARPRLLVLSHPNNPTGGIYTREALDALARFAVAEELIVVVDELYCRLVFSGAEYTHLGILSGMAERTVTLAGPSKTESMSGYRVGIAVGPAPAVDAMERVQSLASLRTAGYGQQALRHWMDGDAAWLDERIAGHQKLRDSVVSRLRTLPGVRVAQPAGSSYVFPGVDSPRWRGDGGTDDHALAIAIKKAGVLVTPGYQFGPAGQGHFRINFSQDAERLGHALDRIAGVLAGDFRRAFGRDR